MTSAGDDRLTSANAKAMKSGDTLRDGVVKGLELRCGASRQSFRLYYRTREGVERRPTVGQWPALSIEQARRIAREILERVAAGEDPSGDWQESRAAPTVAALWEIYVKWLARNREASTVKEYTRQANAVLLPHPIARKKVKDVRLTDVEDWLADVRNRKMTAVPHGASGRAHSPSKQAAPKAANRALAILSGMFKHAELRTGEPPWRARGSNPCKGAETAPGGKRDRYATPAEMQRIGDCVREIEKARPREAALLRLHVLTGARTSELVGIRWADLPAGCEKVTLRRHKTSRRTGTKVLLLPPAARAEFAWLAELDMHESGFVFGGLAKEKPLRAFWERVREKAGCNDLEIRDLRRTFASIAYDPSQGETVNSRIIGNLLGHTRPETTSIYTVLFSEVREKTAAATADRAAALLGSKRPKAEDNSGEYSGAETKGDREPFAD